MKKIFMFLFVSLMAISLVLATNGNVGTGQQGASATDAGLDSTQAGQGTGNGTQINTETQNQGEETQLQNQVQVRTGTYMNQAGKQMQVKAGEGNEVKLQSGNAEAKTIMAMTQEQIQNRTKLRVKLSNGVKSEIKVMPDTASETALARLGAKCEGECTIELKEVGNGEQVKAAYEIKTQKQARILGLFKTQMQVQAQVNAETGEVIQAKKPWWAFLASE